jgi:SAM-dependent methyltransferase
MTELDSSVDGRAAVVELIDPGRLVGEPAVSGGYLDLIGGDDPTGRHPGQQLMESVRLARIYERVWRPFWSRVLIGMIGPGMRGEQELAERMLQISPGDRVLDVGCGPGNFTRRFAEASEGGLAVGLDASRPMLARAVEEGLRANLAYVRGDAAALPFRDGSFEAVCCFAALHLFADPFAALDEMRRVLMPGGRIALMTSVQRQLAPRGPIKPLAERLSGIRVFGQQEIVDALRQRRFDDIHQRLSGLVQFVGGRLVPGPDRA